MMKSFFILVMACFLFGCSKKTVPVQVKGELKIGQYTISPPISYWHFPREYPQKLAEKGFILTFYKDEKDINTIAKKEPVDFFINFGLFENKYKNIETYYASAKAAGIIHKNLPTDLEVSLRNKNWSCKQTVAGLYGIECISLGPNLIIIGAYGYEKNNVLPHITLLQNMLETFKVTK